MKKLLTRILPTLLFSLLSITPAFAAAKKISGKVSGVSSGSVIAITSKGSRTASITNGKFNLTLPTGAKSARLVLLTEGKLSGIFYAKKCANTKGKLVCSATQLAPSFKGGSLPTAKYDATKGTVLVGKFKNYGLYNSSVVKTFVKANVAASGKNLGFTGASQAAKTKAVRPRAVDPTDSDGDGAPNYTDADADNDGVLDSYDSSAPASPGASSSFPLFSNLKLQMNESINVNAGSLTTSLIDTTMQNATTLAIGVLADTGKTSELNCGGLTYCSTGGTGKTLNGNQDFPGTAGGANDVDSDGYGEITKGGTGDFQLKPGANSTEIGSGDTLLQIVTDNSSGVSETIPSMLNFTFNTTPALKTIQVNSDTPVTVTYPIGNSDPGTMNNCIPVPSAGDVSVTLTAWRPQRAGISGAGEGAYVDIGNLTVNIDLPNAPTSGGPSGPGAGLCSLARLSSTDPNLSADTGKGKLRDTKGDIDSDVTNTFTFAVDLTGCLSDRSISWNSGESLSVDLQMQDDVGDNAAVKFCVQRQ